MSPTVITLIFLAFAIIMFVTEKIPLGLTSMIVCIGLVITGVLDVKTAFAGFIDSNVILFVAMFIVGGALFETGMANKIGGIVTHFARSERSLIVAIMVIVGLMSGVLSNTGTAAVLIPVVIGIAAKSGYARSKLLMPLVFAAAMGGNLSLIGAPGNLIAQSALGEIGMSFGFFEYAIVGLPILAVGILFYATLGMKLLPNHPVSDDVVRQHLGDMAHKVGHIGRHLLHLFLFVHSNASLALVHFARWFTHIQRSCPLYCGKNGNAMGRITMLTTVAMRMRGRPALA